MLAFLDFLKDGSQYVAVSKQALAEAFTKKFPNEPAATNEELVATFMEAYDKGYIDVDSVGGKTP